MLIGACIIRACIWLVQHMKQQHVTQLLVQKYANCSGYQLDRHDYAFRFFPFFFLPAEPPLPPAQRHILPSSPPVAMVPSGNHAMARTACGGICHQQQTRLEPG